MADTGIKISGLTAASTGADADVLAGVQSGTTKKFPLSVLLNYIKGKLTASDIGAQATITASGILKGNGSGSVSAAVAGTDYATPASVALKADKSDLASISITGSTNNTGSTISSGKFFYKDGVLVEAKTDIANGATLTSGTNYDVPSAGALNELKSAIGNLGNVAKVKNLIIASNASGTFEIPRRSNGTTPGFIILGARSNVGTICVLYNEWGDKLTIVDTVPSNWSIAFTHTEDGTKSIVTITNNGVSTAQFTIIFWDFDF